MPKVLEYPTASLKKSLELSEAISELGGTASIEMAAEKLGKSVSGGFYTLVTSAVKFGLIVNSQGQLTLTQLYKNYKLAYSEKESKAILQEIFLKISLFQEVYDRFKTQKLPVEILDKILIKEFEVNEKLASRVAKYFIEAVKFVGLLNPDNSFNLIVSTQSTSDEKYRNEKGYDLESISSLDEDYQFKMVAPTDSTFSIRISGPGINSIITLVEEDDLVIVDAMLKKVRNKLSELKRKTESK